MTPVKLVEVDSAPDITFTLTDKVTGAALDLTTFTSAELRFRQLGTTTLLATLVPIVLGDPLNGQLIMEWGTTLEDLPAGSVPGFFEGQLKMLFGTKLLSGYDALQFYVKPSF
jgi:hypothetical protein